MLSPWHVLLDHKRFSRVVDRVQELPIVASCGAHGPIVRGSRLNDAFRMLRELPHTATLSPFTQADVESWISQAAGAAF